ncbi:MAG: phosphoribosylformylglycinamidine synthase subunit PurL [Elusimicrobiota bacterium]|nr:phosphoribosylformylglycinamidine synthase subunit PurL [Elusimicrobiota bacterium]
MKKKYCENIALSALSDAQLLQLSKTNVLALSLKEMKTVQHYFKLLKREPTDIELETIAQTWSEHCKHKTLTSPIEYQEISGAKKTSHTFNNLLKETIFEACLKLKKKWCLSVFADNAGIIEFDENYGAAFKVETHNHPSSLEPYGGAATGIGGVIRDILGVGLGAKPLADTDVFCFADPKTPAKKVPQGLHSPRRIIKGVVGGVRDYGNRMGIPTVDGAVCFDECFLANPLVYCGTMGLIPKNKISKKVSAAEFIVVVGGRTGRDGIHGATFSSVKLDKDSDVSAVQIGNPIMEKKVLDALLIARDLNLYTALTDCGAGGLSSAVGELASETGARVELEKAPLKYPGLLPWEIWISEAQERMVLAVKKKNLKRLLKIFKDKDVEASVLGNFTSDKKLTLLYNKEIIGQIQMQFLHEGLPKVSRKAVYHIAKEIKQKPIKMSAQKISAMLIKVLADLNVCSKEWIIRQYDFEVQGQTIVKPLESNSIEVSGNSDAAVIFPYTLIADTKKAIVLSNGINVSYGKINTYKMGAAVIEQALRNAVCVGANIDKISLLDNFCWGNCDNPEVLGSLAACAKACFDFSCKFGTPFISGKDSLNNEYSVGGKKFSITPTLLVSAMGIIENINNVVTLPFKKEGNKIFVLGLTRNEMGGSIFNSINKISDGILCEVFADESKPLMQKIYAAMQLHLIESCHDASEGGLGVCISQMCFCGQLGARIDIDNIKVYEKMTPAEILFSESNGRFVIEVKPENVEKIYKIFRPCIFSEVGAVGGKDLIIESAKNKMKIKQNINVLMKAWQKTLWDI